MAARVNLVDGNGCIPQVVTELCHIKELVRQQEVHLDGSVPDLCKHLASQISSIADHSISMLSDASDDPIFKATMKRNKKRHELRVSNADLLAGDGHNWRMYGQKEILGAKHRRAYYRCTHWNSQGCKAVKQVQGTDEDPTFFNIVYIGEHTCVQGQRAAVAPGQAATDAQAPEYKYNANPGASSLLQSLSSSLTVEPEQQLQGWDAPAPFCFSTPAMASGCLMLESSPFSAPSRSKNWGVSSATSDSNHVASFPPFEVAGDDAFFRFDEADDYGFLDDPDSTSDVFSFLE
ncbi:unnamed protein product [Miscanthus lutarioriparius]|uniref:WRKY domain-containing protein n=1 Tax=Miscanthus lutarioriparius TaxID=422564 RepID=A0A811QHI4_9POAL|nr:unnamed protein product [Miscanthus lutarioriparius]